ncbi:cytochrome P450 [Rhodococcus sp. USK10]|uniref:Putative cytochrome P450 hydroxylase n=1 Tax=Rhodococcus wratislaviensis TaxID=44752 RepID=A0A402CC12_RHOWR|nr:MULTISPECIES: cytochrome P450 [Rhodococcus]QYB02149.1 cytochrome P450 [Rhodococcus sp. USK10]GCE41175.1 putative cytochrome P450 hydroxylase [Rhodococcus wratislaviensis]
MSVTTPIHNDLPRNVPSDRVVDFDMYNPSDIGLGLQEVWVKLQEESSHGLVWTPRNGGHWITLSADLLEDVHSRPRTFSNQINFLPKSAGSLNFLPSALDPPEHRPYRRILSEVLGPAAVRSLEPVVRATAEEIVDGLKPRGRCDFVKDYAEILPVRIFLELVDLPRSDGEYLKGIADQMTRPDGSMTLAEARQKYFDYLSPIVDERTKNPGEDVLSKIAGASIDGRKLSKDEVLRFAGLLLLAGLDTVVNLLSFIVQFLAGAPAARRHLIEHPEDLERNAEELLRRFGPVADARLVTEDIELDGVTVLDGDMVALPTMLFGLDKSKHPCPMNVDFTRESSEHFTFGHGVHHCAGSHLARMEVHSTLRALLAEIPDFEIVPGEKVEHLSGIVGAVRNLPLQWTAAPQDGPSA